MFPSAAHDPGIHDHDAQLEAAVTAALSCDSPDLRAFLSALNGADPILAVKTLLRQVCGAHTAQVEALLREALTPVDVTPSELPIVHPLDFAWLFTPATQARLLNHVRDATSSGDLVVYLGCPTLHHLALRELSDRQHLLLDRDTRRVARANEQVSGSAHCVDLLVDQPDTLGAALVLADPPWYPAAAAAFTNAAAILMRPRAVLLLAFADRLTRPGADDDRAAVVLSAEQDGLELVKASAGTCRYQMPPYERAAFTAAGLPGIPTDWRRGGLLRLRRRAGPAPPRRTVKEPAWVSCELNEIPLRVLPSAPAIGDAFLQPLLNGAILPSVSRRDPRREHAALWTSRNRIYGSSDPPRLAHALSADTVADLPRRLRDELAAILALERAEHGLPPLAVPSRDPAT
jgi:hypothetical protein